MKNMYWQTTIWIAAVSFPVFAMSFRSQGLLR
jgi:hypothetical protein